MGFWINALAILVGILFALRQWGLPYLFSHLTQFRVSTVSLLTLSVRALEWRPKGQGHDVVPTLRVEKTGWFWGGAAADQVGWVVLRIEGVTFRVKQQESEGKDREQKPPRTKSTAMHRAIENIIGIAVNHQHPIIARLISIQINDIRIIFDDFEGLEVTLKTFQLGMKVKFESQDEDQGFPLSPITSPVSSPIRTFKDLYTANDHSPADSSGEFSPPGSPSTFPPMSYTTFGRTAPEPDRRSSVSHARQRATVYSSRLLHTASKILVRAIGRAKGSVDMTAALDGFDVILPLTNPPGPASSRPSVSQMTESGELPHKVSIRSFRSLSQSAKTLPSANSLSVFLRSGTTRQLPRTAEDGSESLFTMPGRSMINFSLGFAGGKRLLSEDTLSTKFNLAKVHTSLAAMDKLQDLSKARNARHIKPEPTEPKPNQWKPEGLPRVILRAFSSVTVDLDHITLSHHLPHVDSNPTSASSSATDITVLTPVDDEHFTLALDVSHLVCTLSAADSSNNDRARNAFGTNTSPESKVRGIAFSFGWDNIELQCIAPGESSHEKSQLVAIRNADFDGSSFWRPHGWTREELLFASDPNLGLVVGRGSVGSVNVAGDVQLLDELKEAWKQSRSSRAASPAGKPRESFLPPRIRAVFDLGDFTVLVADRVSERQTTLSIHSDGLHIGCYTSYSDVIARRRDKAATRAAYQLEEELQQRRQTSDIDLTMPEAMLKPELRRRTVIPAQLSDDYSLSMHLEASVSIEPIAIHITLSGVKASDVETAHLASIGRIHASVGGDILGKEIIDDSGTERAQLDVDSLLLSIDLGIDQGIKANLWRMPIIDALVTLGHARRQTASAAREVRDPKTVLSRLPSGISARVSFGLISVFIGHEDLNPKCKLQLTRGLWVQTQATYEYAYFDNKIQAKPTRHALTSAIRRKLSLPEDLATQALAQYNALSAHGGRAALAQFALMDTFVKPIFHGERFCETGCANMSHEPVASPKPRVPDDFVGWDFFKPKVDEDLHTGTLASDLPPLEVADTVQASRPLVRVPSVSVRYTIKSRGNDEPVEHLVSADLGHVWAVADLSHIYCALLAILTIRKVVDSWKKPKHEAKPKSTRDLRIDVGLPFLSVHFAFPLNEQVYLHIASIRLWKYVAPIVHATTDQALLYVPSPRRSGMWEELARIKKFGLKAGVERPLSFVIDAEALRVRIPTSYQLSGLILNISVTVKALKLLVEDLGGRGFSFARKPGAEAPKRIPKLEFNIRYLSLEARDNPIETSLNLIWRTGLHEQERRIQLEDAFEMKLQLLREAEENGELSDDSINDKGVRHVAFLTKRATIADSLARYKLDHFHARSWTKAINGVKAEHRRQEMAAMRHMALGGKDVKLPIAIAESSTKAPLFRATFDGVKICVQDPGWSRAEIIQYMGDVSAPFSDDVEFSLMIPLNLSWSMDSAKVAVRDYPLPLIRIQAVDTGPAWHVETPFIIAEELKGDDSMILIPCQVIPEGCGAKDARSFTVEIAKTIMPVKTYTRPVVKIASEKITEFTWGNSYQPAIQDVMKVIETLTQPPRDPSPKIGFWDKFRLILHWKVSIDFHGPVHLHLKGSFDPYAVTGLGAGFALAWRGNTRFEINQPNEQYETIQIASDELVIAIPDLSALNDATNAGESHLPASAIPQRERGRSDQSLMDRRYTKPCARFVNGVRVGFGFAFERTCRPHTCDQQCGETENVFHRACRLFDFKQHQEVVLRSPEAIERDEQRIGRSIDSYEGFRSDFVHFSVSVVSPLKPVDPRENLDTDMHSSMHCSPKAFAHFFAWWRLFDHKMSLPIRQGSLFPDAPPASKKFGRSLGTIKYRFDIKDLFLSHMYQQVSQDLWATGRSQSLGVKIRFGEFRADAHQRAQEMRVRHEKLHRDTAIIHKPFYAADLQLKKVDFRALRADFVETHVDVEARVTDDFMINASELQPEDAVWYNILDYIDVDRKPLDRDPRLEIANVGDCPQVFISKRVKARQIMSGEQRDEEGSSDTGSDSQLELESTKFGHEKSHICYLGAAAGVGETQIVIAEERIAELKEREAALTDKDSAVSRRELTVVRSRLNTLYRHRDELAVKERRQIDDDTLQRSGTHDKAHAENRSGEVTFENTIHVHNPRAFFNNSSRNILFKYLWSSRDRKKEEYTTSHAALRGVRDSIQQRMRRLQTGFNQDDLPDDAFPAPADVAMDMLRELERVLRDKSAAPRFKLPPGVDSEFEELRKASIGLADNTVARPKHSILVLKPQIALRSSADHNAIVLLAVEEVSFKSFQVLDQGAKDNITADVLARNFASMKGLQAFYPNQESMQRERGSYGVPRGLDFVPLEIFLDVRSEATDYDRIVLKTDVAVSIDKFNRLRMPRGLDWPDVEGENGENHSHLRIHQDLTTIVIPRITVSATSEHYTALYNIVTDLLIYQDPEHRHRSERVDSFVFAFDRKDRDPQRLIADLFSLQQSIRSLSQLQRGYEANVDLLTEGGKGELFKIRTDCLEATEQLFTVFEVINVNQARDDARAALKSAARTDVRAGSVAWHMLRDDLRPLVKLDIEGTLFSYVSNKDGSTDSAMTFGDLSILNSNADAVYPEVVARHESSASGRKKLKDPMMSISWSTLAPVGGIPIYRHLFVNIIPIRFRIEERVGHQIVDYIFNDRVKRRDEQAKGGAKDKDDKETKRTSSGMEISLHRTPSSASISSQSTTATRHTQGEELGKPDAKFTMVPSGDAAEMRRRAKTNFTFVKIMVDATSLVLSYKGEEGATKRHKKWSVPDMVDFKVKTPNLMYSNKVWSWEDIFEHVKRDFRSAIWSQTGDLLSQVFMKTSIFRSKKALRHVAALSSDFPAMKRDKSDFSPPVHSNLRLSVEPPTPSDESVSTILGRSLSRSESSGNPLSRIISSRGQSHASPSLPSTGYVIHDDSEDESEQSDHEGAVGKAVKGLLGKLKKHRHDSPAASSEELSRPETHSSHASRRKSSISGLAHSRQSL